ncbi:Uncharacterised protein [Klebsiella pneumoniae]|nr:Uncharacterised protein [Klebsiella pneumoniae]
MIISMNVWNFPGTPLVAFLATLRNMARNRRPKTTEKNMESMLIVQKVAGGLCGSTSENVRRSS